MIKSIKITIVENTVTLLKNANKKTGKLKNKLNILNIDNSDKKDLIWILESQSSDSFDIDILTSSESNY